jgi:hypothetical protein
LAQNIKEGKKAAVKYKIGVYWGSGCIKERKE